MSIIDDAARRSIDKIVKHIEELRDSADRLDELGCACLWLASAPPPIKLASGRTMRFQARPDLKEEALLYLDKAALFRRRAAWLEDELQEILDRRAGSGTVR